MSELISVIMPTYNRERTIERAIKSVLEQSYKNIEFIIIDDKSTDNTCEIIEKINDDRIRLIRLEKNGGACKARNIGIMHANGTYIAFMDSDDEWLTDKLEYQIKLIKEKNADFIGGAMHYTNKNGDKKIASYNSQYVTYQKSLAHDVVIGTATMFGKTQCFKDVKFDEKMPRFQDWELTIRFTQKYIVFYDSRPVINVYWQADSITANWKAAQFAMVRIREKNKEAYKFNVGARKAYNYYMYTSARHLKDYRKNYYWQAYKEGDRRVKIFIAALAFPLMKLFKI